MMADGIFGFAAQVIGMQARGELEHFLEPAAKVGRLLTAYQRNPLSSVQDLQRFGDESQRIRAHVVELLEYLAELELWPDEAVEAFEASAVGFRRWCDDIQILTLRRQAQDAGSPFPGAGEPPPGGAIASEGVDSSPPGDGAPFTKSPGAGDMPAPGASSDKGGES